MTEQIRNPNKRDKERKDDRKSRDKRAEEARTKRVDLTELIGVVKVAVEMIGLRKGNLIEKGWKC